MGLSISTSTLERLRESISGRGHSKGGCVWPPSITNQSQMRTWGKARGDCFGLSIDIYEPPKICILLENSPCAVPSQRSQVAAPLPGRHIPSTLCCQYSFNMKTNWWKIISATYCNLSDLPAPPLDGHRERELPPVSNGDPLLNLFEGPQCIKSGHRLDQAAGKQYVLNELYNVTRVERCMVWVHWWPIS